MKSGKKKSIKSKKIKKNWLTTFSHYAVKPPKKCMKKRQQRLVKNYKKINIQKEEEKWKA